MATKHPTDQLPIRYDYYLDNAQTWAHILNHMSPLPPTITELLPGWAPKIPLALTKTNFQGQYHAIDLDSQNLSLLQSLTNPLIKKFTIKTTTQNILTSPIAPSEYIIMNHAIDDLILYYCLNQGTTANNPFNDIEKLNQIWIHTQLSSAEIEYLANLLAQNIIDALKPQGKLLIAQYPGYQEKLYQLNKSHHLSLALIHALAPKLLQRGLIQDVISPQKILTKLQTPYFTPADCFFFTKQQ